MTTAVALIDTAPLELHQLHRLAGCDEWTVQLYADYVLTRERVATGNPAIRLLREEWAAARPRRACYLEQRLRDLSETATKQALSTIAQRAFNWLSGYAVAAQLKPVRAVTHSDGEVEILRASFLVARDGAEQFKEEVRFSGVTNEGLRCENRGPWPPHSFVRRGASTVPGALGHSRPQQS